MVIENKNGLIKGKCYTFKVGKTNYSGTYDGFNSDFDLCKFINLKMSYVTSVGSTKGFPATKQVKAKEFDFDDIKATIKVLTNCKF